MPACSPPRALRRAKVDVTVLDRTNHHLFQPLLYQVATGVLSEGDIAPPMRDVLRHQENARVLLGEVVHIDLALRAVYLDTFGTKSMVPYDSLIVAAGAAQSYFGHDEFAIHAPGMKTIDDALELRGRIFGAFEMAELDAKVEHRDAWLTFVIIGAGPTGVELAGQIAELRRRALRHDFRSFDLARARPSSCLDGLDTVLAAFPQPLQRRAQRDLARPRSGGSARHSGGRGSTRTASTCRREQAKPAAQSARTKIWAAGVAASPLGAIIICEQSDAELDRAGKVIVEQDCSIPGHPEVFVVGDLMNLNGLPGLAEVAMQSGVHASRTIVRRLNGHTEKRAFRYIDLGMMATISRFRAIVSVGPLRVAGLTGWLMWLVVHLAFLTGFKNRVAAVANWAISFLGRGRRQRTITAQQVFARTRASTDERAERASSPQ